MSTAAPWCEVVCVIDRNRLVDSESYERSFGSDGAHEVRSGYYIAQWPPGTSNPHFFHDGLRFEGPYETRSEAEAALAVVLRQ